MAKKLGYSEALYKMLRGEIIPAKRLSEDTICFLRAQAFRYGKKLVDSGIFDYRCYSFADD